MAPLENMLKKEAPYEWNEEFQKYFEQLKEKFLSTPILIFPY